jgi:hypothetical protein
LQLRKPTGMALAATAALTVGAIVPTTGSAESSGTHITGVTVHVVEHAVTDTEIPTGGGKDVKGNILTFSGFAAHRPAAAHACWTCVISRGVGVDP